MPPRSVFDCNLYVQAFLSESGPARACFRLAEEGAIVLIASEAILDEVRDVLGRPFIRRLAPSTSPEGIDAFIEWTRSISVVLSEIPSVYEVARDPKDSHYIDTAVHSSADYVVSRDKDLLDLATDDAFASGFPHIRILNPVAFLELFPDCEAAEPGLVKQ